MRPPPSLMPSYVALAALLAGCGPTAPTVRLEPEEPFTTQDLVVRLDAEAERAADEDGVVWSYDWYTKRWRRRLFLSFLLAAGMAACAPTQPRVARPPVQVSTRTVGNAAPSPILRLELTAGQAAALTAGVAQRACDQLLAAGSADYCTGAETFCGDFVKDGDRVLLVLVSGRACIGNDTWLAVQGDERWTIELDGKVHRAPAFDGPRAPRPPR